MKNLTFVDPYFNTYSAVGGFCFCKAVVDIGSDGLKRDSAFLVCFGTRYFGAAETAGAADLDALGAHAH